MYRVAPRGLLVLPETLVLLAPQALALQDRQARLAQLVQLVCEGLQGRLVSLAPLDQAAQKAAAVQLASAAPQDRLVRSV